jgi:hypothetical protein
VEIGQWRSDSGDRTVEIGQWRSDSGDRTVEIWQGSAGAGLAGAAELTVEQGNDLFGISVLERVVNGFSLAAGLHQPLVA